LESLWGADSDVDCSVICWWSCLQSLLRCAAFHHGKWC